LDILGLLPQFGGLIWTLLAFVVALSVIVAIHEYGHYIVGRWCGIKADVFSIGFGPVLWSRADKRGTRWQIAALPFGGYVKFAGDANAASGKDEVAMAALAENPSELRHTMHGAPLWARTLTVAAGPVFNFILSALVFFSISLFVGTPSEPLTVAGFTPMPAQEYELRAGDRILAIAGVRLDELAQERPGLIERLPDTPVVDYTVERDGQEQVVTGPQYAPAVVGRVMPTSAADAAGLRRGDVITAVDGEEIHSFGRLKEIVEASGGASMALTVWRDGETQEFSFAPKVVDEQQRDGGFVRTLRIGIASGTAILPETERRGVLEAAQDGVAGVWTIITSSLSGLVHMISGAISTCNMSGPIGIAQVSGSVASQGAVPFIEFIAVLSTAVGLLNLFPIPALDGGHLVFYAYEAVVRRPPSDRAARLLMTIGLAMVLTLMIFALYNDIFCP
jgi:regulator of sigma E protease